MDAEIMCGVEPTKPADTMVKNSSSDAVAVGALASICGICDWSIWPPWAIFLAIRTSSSKAAVRAFSLTSLAEITTSERIEGMKWRLDWGRCSITTTTAARRSRRAAAEAEAAVDRSKDCNSELRSCNAREPAGQVARRGRSL